MAAAVQRCTVLALLATLASGIRTVDTKTFQRGAPVKLDDAHRHVIAMPSQKLAFCYVQKVASEHFAQLFNAANNLSVSLDPEPSTPHKLGLDYSEVSRKNGWRFAMFVRDPLERYLSAFLAKCVPTGNNKDPANGGKHCHGPTRSVPVTMEEKIALFEDHVRSDSANGLPEDDHWQSQYTVMKLHCGADNFDTNKLDFIGRMTYDVNDVNRQVQEMLGFTSLSDAEGLATQFFPLSSKKTPLSLVQCPKEHCTKSHSQLEQFYRKLDTVLAVVRLYRDDYEHFGFPVRDFNKTG